MSSSGELFKKAIISYIKNWNKDIEIREELPVGYRFVDSVRMVDIVLYYEKKFLGIECKYQSVEGTAYQKLSYALEDCITAPIPMILVFAGETIKLDMQSKLIMSGRGIKVNTEEIYDQNNKLIEIKITEGKKILLQRISIELGINWLDLF